MSIKQGFLIELERETANTRRILANLTDADLTFQPHEKSMTLGNLAGHIVELHNWVSIAISTNDFNIATDYKPLKPTSVAELQEVLEAGFIKNQSLIKSLPEEQWLSQWTVRVDNYIIGEMPKLGAIRFVVYNHLIHHRGQLSVYLRLLDIPVPGLYGPSADEQIAK
ncbi:DinB family protein [Sphingobacteriaceae bacterium WQ 2009]|uniref:DinB family protein n=1 Tax=Rhinopithecimicrobium faecis TaxID=2820698 RepID=A0A8T4HD82_9SPHI|nr:DinB family protein [Sphingobacteriaceae bacterium WQ 2009]